MPVVTEVNDVKKIVTIWLTRAEKDDADLREGLKNLYAEYRAKKYMVAVFSSGTEDLYTNTLDLLKYNKRRLAEQEVQREKQAAAGL